MTYLLKLYEADVPPDQLRAAEHRFRQVLEATLGDAALVAPVYRAYLRIVGEHGDSPSPAQLTEAERLVFEQWQAAEKAAVAAVFGPERHMGDAMYEIRLQ